MADVHRSVSRFHHISIENHRNIYKHIQTIGMSWKNHEIPWDFPCIGHWTMSYGCELVTWRPGDLQQWPGASKLLASKSCCSAYSKLGIQYLDGAMAATAAARPALLTNKAGVQVGPSADPATTIAPDQKRGHHSLSKSDVCLLTTHPKRVLSIVIQFDNLKWQFYRTREIRGNMNLSLKMHINRAVTRTKLPITSRTPRHSRWSSTASMTVLGIGPRNGGFPYGFHGSKPCYSSLVYFHPNFGVICSWPRLVREC